ncbi:hypothetical protein CBFG_03949 [Clostridiales bacterium 1_7_47FAA]|nr:hypothetical protein CBFG_03949 [Clostridiales bacterium 1_7_47FAA]
MRAAFCGGRAAPFFCLSGLICRIYPRLPVRIRLKPGFPFRSALSLDFRFP